MPAHHETVTARLVGPAKPPKIAVTASGLGVTLALPPSFGGKPAPGTTNPEQLFGGAYAGCFTFALQYVGAKARADLTGLQCTAQVRVGRGTDGGNDLEVDLLVELPGVDQASAEALAVEAERYCPFHRALGSHVPRTLTVRGAVAG